MRSEDAEEAAALAAVALLTLGAVHLGRSLSLRRSGQAASSLGPGLLVPVRLEGLTLTSHRSPPFEILSGVVPTTTSVKTSLRCISNEAAVMLTIVASNVNNPCG